MKKTYVISDIHGELEKFKRMLETIKFTNTDKLYIIGDIIDRGPESIELVKYIMKKKNITLIKGNHESMMVESIELGDTIRKDKEKLDLSVAVEVYKDWLNNGGGSTLDQFRSQTKPTQEKIINFLKSISEYKILNIGGKYYLLIHAGLFIPKENIELKSLINANIKAQELHLYVRDEFWNSEIYLEDGMIMVVGHTSTRYIPEIKETAGKSKISKDNKKRCKEDRIYVDKNVIGIDCGSHLKTGKLACLRLDDMQEFYI